MFEKSFKAGENITARRFVKFGDDENTVLTVTSSDDQIIGVSGDTDVSAGNYADVAMVGFNKVQYGEDVAQGDYIKADETGRAVKADDGESAIGIAIATCEEDEIDYFVFARITAAYTSTDTETDTDTDTTDI